VNIRIMMLAFAAATMLLALLAEKNGTGTAVDRGRGRYRGRKGIGMAFGHERLNVYRAAMLTKLGQRGYAVHGGSAEYRTERIDPDTDTDPDPERKP
jgi:hypothetical protein